MHNTEEEILSASEELLRAIFRENEEACRDMVSMIFTLTNDLDAVFPAKAARLMGITDVPLMCMSEIPVKGALEMCIRVLIYTNTDLKRSEINHVYLGEAVRLRPDLAKQGGRADV